MIKDNNRIIIFDTTLRDGEQSPGASLGMNEKLQIAQALQALGVDVIEAGFPAASAGDLEAVRLIARRVKGPVICGLARATAQDINKAGQALRPAKRPRIHVFLATSKIHMKYKLKKAEDEILRLAVWGVKYARRFAEDVEFSPEDASRTEREFLFRVLEAVIAAGASTVNIPDTVGYAHPAEFGDLIHAIKINVPNIERAVISVHCHNDLGLAVANSLAAVANGARQVECTINGIGERAGNASLEEVVMALKVRQDYFLKASQIDTAGLYKTSRLVSKLTGIVVQPNKAIVGQNAFAHEAGIHQDGILKRRTTYEIIRPQDVGFKESRLVLGKHSGRHAFSERLKALGYRLSKGQFEKAFVDFKGLADKKKEIFDEDLRALIEDDILIVPETYKLDEFSVSCGTKEAPAAKVSLKYRARSLKAESTGDGPVDACYRAIGKLTKIKARLVDYSIRAVTAGKEALGEVAVSLRVKNRQVSGRGASTDIIEASIKAYLNAVNKLVR